MNVFFSLLIKYYPNQKYEFIKCYYKGGVNKVKHGYNTQSSK